MKLIKAVNICFENCQKQLNSSQGDAICTICWHYTILECFKSFSIFIIEETQGIVRFVRKTMVEWQLQILIIDISAIVGIVLCLGVALSLTVTDISIHNYCSSQQQSHNKLCRTILSWWYLTLVIDQSKRNVIGSLSVKLWCYWLLLKSPEVQDDPTTYETILGFKPLKIKIYAVHFVIIDLLSQRFFTLSIHCRLFIS